MARRSGAALKTAPGSPEGSAPGSEEHGEERPTFVDGNHPDEPGRTDEEVVLELEPETPGAEEPGKDGKPGEKKPGETPARGEGKKTPEQLEVENRNLKAALRESRGKTRSILDEIERERDARRQAEAAENARRGEAAKSERLKKLDDAADIKEALPVISEEIIAQVEPGIVAARKGVIRLSQKLARQTYEDYDDVLEQSGVAEAISLDAQGRPKDQDTWRKIILNSEDPGEDAYALAKEILNQRGEGTRTNGRPAGRTTDGGETVVLDDTVGDRSTGRREVLSRIANNAGRPGTLRRLPTSPGREPRKLTLSDIDNMSDAEYSRLPAHVREQYLAAGRVE